MFNSALDPVNAFENRLFKFRCCFCVEHISINHVRCQGHNYNLHWLPKNKY